MQAYFFFMWISVTSHAMAIVMGLPIKGDTAANADANANANDGEIRPCSVRS